MSESKLKEIMLSLPQHLLNEIDGMASRDKMNRSEFLHRAIRLYLRERNRGYVREIMRQGYMEMAKINLNIASEAFLAEEEAEVTMERSVSGV
ncbi:MULTISPECIES: CopG family ribbon-helix-helix protein [Sporolactobacillus]|jgi:CopG family transcriptional regulator/antitoxin EndoAI|uniref:CopG family transcriptional regulator / antitoxin EndoAI n=1 Tax=Sporolactobacillus nakayamae TaxID=269670 RepID=A0A1I2WAU4_9BACL|nr:ribbon-helix-helix protein, CopG family [Sporolactobacillus nakayamae]SFG97737.1 CopG family transcriptional regulator / antitoxin EndoAI [Sporolactobacillus nakayamae]